MRLVWIRVDRLPLHQVGVLLAGVDRAAVGEASEANARSEPRSDAVSARPPCCDIGYGLNFTLSARSGGVGFRVRAAVGMRMRTPNVQVSQNLAVNLYNFGVGIREGTTGAREPQADLIYSVSATIGGGEQGRLPLHTHSGLTATGVANDYAVSVTHGQNFVLNSSGRNQRSGSYGLRLADMRVQTYNDV